MLLPMDECAVNRWASSADQAQALSYTGSRKDLQLALLVQSTESFLER